MSMRIDPDGTIAIVAGDSLANGQTEFKHCTVVRCGAPFLPADRTWVGVIDDFGAQDLPLNRKAWALYGRSPIYGPMWFSADAEDYVPESLLAFVHTDLLSWPIPAEVAQYLMAEPDRPDMVLRRPAD